MSQVRFSRYRSLIAALAIGALAVVAAILLVRTSSVSAQSLLIVKSADAEYVQVGDIVRYTIVVTNSVDGSVTISDVIPYGVSVTGASPGATFPSSPDRVEWTVPLVAGVPQTVWFDVQVDEPGTAGLLPIVNRAQADGVWSNQVTVYAGNLSISKSADVTYAQVYDYVTYTIVVTSAVDASVTVSDVIPYGVSYDSASPPPNVLSSPDRVEWTLTLVAGVPQTVWFRVQVDEPGTAGLLPIVNRAQVNGLWSNTVTVYAGNLSISKSANETFVHPGGTITYTVVFTSTGSLTSTATMTDVIPFGVYYVTGSAWASEPTVSFETSPDRVEWVGDLGPFVPVVTVTFAVTVERPSTPGPFLITNQAYVQGLPSNEVVVRTSRRVLFLPILVTNWANRPPWPWSVD